ncbi:hypothetical protein BDR05DRAFT_978538 [Suillus weaverae]|nr:hypothetical protein BDR05DRAFT_978538 [Suillus weaverae]
MPGTSKCPRNELDSAEHALPSKCQYTQLDNLKHDISLIQALQNTTLDDGTGLKGKKLKQLCNSPQQSLHIDDPSTILTLRMFVVLEHSSQDTYVQIHEAVIECYPDSDVPPFHHVKTILADLNGVESLINHMCINLCTAFIGPYADYIYQIHEVQQSHQESMGCFHTIPIGPQLQALWRNPENTYDNILTGSTYLNAVQDGYIKTEDMLLIISIDGAQLYESKSSDCWIYIWIIIEHFPDQCYKKKNVLPGTIILGPNKPKFIESFLFPGFHHLSALQHEGLTIWDASRDHTFISRLFLFLACAYGPSLICMSNFVGHSGKVGCCHRKPGASQYYPVLLKPHNYSVVGCDHNDVNVYNLPLRTSEGYTGIVGPSILLGLQPQHVLGVPECFSSEIMHYAGANMASTTFLTHTDLWRGTMDCSGTDTCENWPWVVLIGDTWEEHGCVVTACKSYLPGSFNAVEYIMWLYYLCPALLYRILPDNFVTALRIMSQYRITPAQITKACQLFADWEHEFKLLQQSDPFSNLTQQGICCYLGNGYILTKSDKKPIVVNGLQSAVIADFLGQPSPKVCCWACLRLPNGQIARSAWTETQKSPEDVLLHGQEHCAEVLYFMQLTMENDNHNSDNEEDENNWHFVNVALVTLYSLPQPELLALSYGALIFCIHEGEESLCVIDVNTIQSVVGMIPHKPTLPNGQVEEWFFLVEKTGLDIACCGLQDDNGDID